MPHMSKPRRAFLIHSLGLFLSISHRINFLQLARHSSKYRESSYRLHFEQYVDFTRMNQAYIEQHGSGHYVLAFDPTYIRKSGRATSGVGKYWSGSAQTALWGLEAGLLSVIDINYHTAFHLEVVQTPTRLERQQKDITLLDHYAQAILWSKSAAESLSGYLAVDAYFAKEEFIERILGQSSLHIISRLRRDANLLYLYEGPKRKGRGAPRKYDGKINVQAPDLSRFTLAHQDEQMVIYSAVVYCKFLQRTIRLAYTQFLNEKREVKKYKLFFSTDLNLPAWMIIKYYQARFQQEFLIRDAKQFTGLNDCQARSINKLEFHWNMALTAINVAKVEQGLSHNLLRKPFSMASIKTLHHNQLLIEQLFNILPENAQLAKNHPELLKLYQFGAIAA